ncbi:protein Tat [Edwardsiella hoshinae]|uniref:Protein Tat n=1 Tax=Edwardsiella hoshinae TaxID=93378 RepID=A0ABN4T2A1_9GAMM|nr:protein Tat [Edwardsiella hoshinae]
MADSFTNLGYGGIRRPRKTYNAGQAHAPPMTEKRVVLPGVISAGQGAAEADVMSYLGLLSTILGGF